ncbi:caspase-8 [Anoplophora glabripennis]|uniref:caspase-8 n=1 Tax=Anoplophora glabripennis TaxID=217634 RepID=UPI0008759DB9|nr:caspase-8 [Anoplophora glabripennis]
MGAGNSNYLTGLSDDSDSDSEFDYSLESRPDKKTAITNSINTNSSQNLVIEVAPNLEIDYTSKEMITTDASAQSFLRPEIALHLDKVLEIEKSLDDYEMVSLVYLLYEEPNLALQELILFLDGAQKNLLYSWANLEESRSHPWQKKLIEALCVIKNYQVLRTLGYKKQDVKDYYAPHIATSITNLNKMKKVIYLICERLNCAKTEKFLSTVKFHFQEKGLIFTEYSPEFLEMYFLKWETMGYISMKDMTNIKQAFKVIEEEALWDALEGVILPREKLEKKCVENIQESGVGEKTPKPRGLSTSTDTHQPASTSRAYSGDFLSSSPSIRQDNGPDFKELHTDNHRYEIDPENPGIILIINQEEFYTEIDEDYKHLLPTDIESNKLESRKGTEKDKEKLISTFTKFGFKIVVAENLTHESLTAQVTEVAKSVTIESSLFVCILSHGDKDVVYGANSCRVKVNKIQEIMRKTNRENLVGKPKILILQSCQGRQCLKLNEITEEDESFSITTDGPNSSNQSVPRTVDMLTFWATVPGYAAIRNTKTGSWFIQALVKKMIELANQHHFADICTRILDDVSGQTWTVSEEEKNAMTPMIVSTLRKYFYLPPLRQD